MQLPPPDSRHCESCLNTMTLNLFRLDSQICRYCENAEPVPKRLTNKTSAIRKDFNNSKQIPEEVNEETLENQDENDSAPIGRDSSVQIEDTDSLNLE